jgi:hypothetical protein
MYKTYSKFRSAFKLRNSFDIDAKPQGKVSKVKRVRRAIITSTSKQTEKLRKIFAGENSETPPKIIKRSALTELPKQDKKVQIKPIKSILQPKIKETSNSSKWVVRKLVKK